MRENPRPADDYRGGRLVERFAGDKLENRGEHVARWIESGENARDHR